jgi:hypothetical protein
MNRTKPVTLVAETRFFASPQQVYCEVASEAVLLSLESGEYFGLNEVAASVWRLIQTPKTLAEVCDGLLLEYDDVDAATCADQTIALLDEMVSLGLVEAR